MKRVSMLIRQGPIHLNICLIHVQTEHINHHVLSFETRAVVLELRGPLPLNEQLVMSLCNNEKFGKKQSKCKYSFIIIDVIHIHFCKMDFTHTDH